MTKAGEKVEFFKDGYTDLAGKFNYGQVSGKDLSDIKKFAIFINHKHYGSLIKSVDAPTDLH